MPVVKGRPLLVGIVAQFLIDSVRGVGDRLFVCRVHVKVGKGIQRRLLPADRVSHWGFSRDRRCSITCSNVKHGSSDAAIRSISTGLNSFAAWRYNSSSSATLAGV